VCKNATLMGQNRMIGSHFRWVCVEKRGENVPFTEEKQGGWRRVYV